MRYNDVGFRSIQVKTFNLKHTFESAQPLTFHADFDELSNTLTYSNNQNIINVRHEGDTENGSLLVASKNISYAEDEVRKRFRLDDNMSSIYKRINTDKFIGDAVRNYSGMRLTVNDPWETTVVFITSQFNNVKRIRRITKNIMEKFGPVINDDYGKPVMRGFPTAAVLAKATEQGIWDCNAGFRAKYLKSAAKYCSENLDLYKLDGKNYDTIKESLLEIDGVGDKVADCIALMGYGKLEAFPIDTWIKRTLENVYFKKKTTSIKKLHEFAWDRWGKYRGYAQQYAFHSARTEKSDEYSI